MKYLSFAYIGEVACEDGDCRHYCGKCAVRPNPLPSRYGEHNFTRTTFPTPADIACRRCGALESEAIRGIRCRRLFSYLEAPEERPVPGERGYMTEKDAQDILLGLNPRQLFIKELDQFRTQCLRALDAGTLKVWRAERIDGSPYETKTWNVEIKVPREDK